MEASSGVKKTWNLGAIWGLVGFLILLLVVNQIHKKSSVLSALADVRVQFKKRCDIFDGRWVYKAEEGPAIAYNATGCPFIDKKLNCNKNGRPDSMFERWTWEARHCDIPQFDGLDMLERLRNKRLIMVGDSISRNMWESLVCLLYSSVNDPSKAEVKSTRPSSTAFKAKDYNCTVEFFWSPFLVELDTNHKSGRKVLVLDKMTPGAEEWLGAHVMVFNSGFWWTHGAKIRRWDVFEYGGQLIEEMPVELAFERGFTTWADWMESNVDPRKTRVLYRSMSVVHYGKQSCGNAIEPIMDESYENNGFPQSLVDIMNRTIKGMTKSQVKCFNITNMSKYRKDAHPSIYWNLDWKNKTISSRGVGVGVGDCSHWCLPGLPDTWNRLLYASLFFDIREA